MYLDHQMWLNNITISVRTHSCKGYVRSFCSKIRGIKAESSQHDKFDIKRLFDAVSSGDVTRLEGLEDYLRKTNKKLTSSECKNYM